MLWKKCFNNESKRQVIAFSSLTIIYSGYFIYAYFLGGAYEENVTKSAVANGFST